jgi:hypothetical protein
MVGFAKRQLSRAPAAQYSLVIVHVFFPFLLRVSNSSVIRVAVIGSVRVIVGITDRQSVDATADVAMRHFPFKTGSDRYHCGYRHRRSR